MNRKIISTIGIICLTLSLVACGGKDKTDVVDFSEIKPQEPDAVIIREENTEEETTQVATEEETTTEEAITPFCDRASVTYQVTEETFEQDHIKITYPQITEMENADLMEQINENIKDQIIPQEVLEDENCSEYEVTYEIETQGTGVLSVVFRGYESYQGAAHPNQFCRTMNLNMGTGDNIRFKDYAPVDAVVTGLEIASGYTILSENVTPDDFSAFMNNGYVTDYAITLLDYDLDFSSDLVVSGYSYIKDNHPVLCIETEHAMGDYVEVLFNLQIE